MVIRVHVLILLLLTLFVPCASAQTAATLSGTVHDASNAVLPGVAVTAKSGETGLTRTAITGQSWPGSSRTSARRSGLRSPNR
jgi:hypothetical protein